MVVLIDSTLGHGMLSFMDSFSRYNQIKMFPKYDQTTAFRTTLSNFYYIVIPFVLKNAKTTYQRVIKVAIHDMMGREVEDYVDHLVVKSLTHNGH